MPTIAFVEEDQRTTDVVAEQHSILLASLGTMGVDMDSDCRQGDCGTCKVQVLEGADRLSAPSAKETETLEKILAVLRQQIPHKDWSGISLRLACQSRVEGDVRVVPFRITDHL